MLPAGFEISTDRNRIDVGLVHKFLDQSYWAKGRTRTVVERCIENSICFGVYAEGEQVAFARVITDCAVFAYLADVFVVPEFRGRGISKALVAAVIGHSDLQGLKVMLLRTRDAHGLYSQFGFRSISEPSEMMALYPRSG